MGHGPTCVSPPCQVISAGAHGLHVNRRRLHRCSIPQQRLCARPDGDPDARGLRRKIWSMFVDEAVGHPISFDNVSDNVIG